MARTGSTALTAAACIAAAFGLASVLAHPAAAQTEKSSDPVTISGCLRSNGNGFVLTRLHGNLTPTPKKRTWKTGFIKKTQTDLVLSAGAGVNLRNQVDRQVTIVGVL